MDNSNSDQGKDVKQKAKATAADATDKIKATAQDNAETVASEAAGYANQAKETAAGEVKNVASALRTAADEMRSGSPQERTFSQIAEGLADASDSMRDKDLGEMVGAVTDFAKRNPMVFLGSAALIGFAATRFAKASSEGHPTSTTFNQRAEYIDLRDKPDERKSYATDQSAPSSVTPNHKEKGL